MSNLNLDDPIEPLGSPLEIEDEDHDAASSLSNNTTSIIRDYMFVVLSVSLSTVLRLALHNLLGSNGLFVTYFPAIVFSAWIAGGGGGITALALSTFAILFFFEPHLNALSHDRSMMISILLFVAAGLGITAFGDKQWQERHWREQTLLEAQHREETLLQNEQSLKQSEARYWRLLETANEGVLTIDQNDVITYANPSMAEMLGYTPEGLRNRPLDHILFADDVAQARERRARRRIGMQEQYELRLMRQNGTELWTVSNVTVLQEDGQFDGTFNRFTDITERKKAEAELAIAYQREVQLNQIGKAIRQSISAAQVQQMVVDVLGKALGADRCLSIVFDRTRHSMHFVSEWRRSDLRSLLGEYYVSRFEVDLDAIFAAGTTLVVVDGNTGARSLNNAKSLAPMRLRSYVNVPFSEDGEVIGVLGVYMVNQPREWTKDEVAMAEAAAAQLRSAMEASRLLTQTQARAEREALINQIGQELRSSLDPETIQETAAQLLGKALHVDRCFFATLDFSRDYLQIGQDWRRKDLRSISGNYVASEYKAVLDELFVTGTAVIPDVRTVLTRRSGGVLEAMQQRSLLAVPLYDNDVCVAVLFAAMADEPRDWTTEEVVVAEQVAGQIRTAVESARLTQRERRIATQLQQALQPSIPEHVPGLDLAFYYRTALAEAEVGGDFADCFSTNKNLTYLVVGDVSGKGLDAAAQVAMIRNMLRFALYNDECLATSVSRLNSTLATYRLVAGFATLFVGRYDCAAQTLTYVNCGQEPALVRRAATNEVEMLNWTGDLLGPFPDSEFDEKTIPMAPGDTLAVFTDGLTEAGPSRTQLLGVNGVASILQEQSTQLSAPVLVDNLIQRIDRFAQDGVRDDVCLLIGIAT